MGPIGGPPPSGVGSTHPADVLARAVHDLTEAFREPEWLAKSRFVGLDAYLNTAPADNQRLVAAQIARHPDRYRPSTTGNGPSVARDGPETDSAVASDIQRDTLAARGVVLLELREAVEENELLVREHLGSLIEPGSNWTEALTAALWTRGHFVYIPESVRVDWPIQPYDRTNASRIDPFDRTLIVAAARSSFSFIEGCSAPVYTADSFRSPMTEIVVEDGAAVSYATIRNYTENVISAETRRARVGLSGTVTWTDANLGASRSIGVPFAELARIGARVEIFHFGMGSRVPGVEDVGAEVHMDAPDTSVRLVSRTIEWASQGPARARISAFAAGPEGPRYVECEAETMNVLRDQGPATVKPTGLDVVIEGSASAFVRTSESARSSRVVPSSVVDDAVREFAAPVSRLLPPEYAIEVDRLVELRLSGLGELGSRST